MISSLLGKNYRKITKSYLMILIFYGLVACSSNSTANQTPSPTTQAVSNQCPARPVNILNPDQVKEISLTSNFTKHSGMVNSTKSLGYIFEAKSGEKLNYRTNDDICIWIYSPENQLLNTQELPLTGKYTIQISAAQGSKTFEIEISLGTPVATASPTTNSTPIPTMSPSYPSPSPTSYSSPPSYSPPRTPSTAMFSKANYPQSTCGDSDPTNSSAYPVNFYPVNVPYSDYNLAKARELFCQDAYKKRSKDTQELSVQIASFTSSRRAAAFAEMVGTEIAGASVGSPTTRYK